MLSLGVFDVLYFRIVAVNGPCLLELADLEISLQSLWCGVGCFYIGVVLCGCIFI